MHSNNTISKAQEIGIFAMPCHAKQEKLAPTSPRCMSTIPSCPGQNAGKFQYSHSHSIFRPQSPSGLKEKPTPKPLVFHLISHQLDIHLLTPPTTSWIIVPRLISRVSPNPLRCRSPIFPKHTHISLRALIHLPRRGRLEPTQMESGSGVFLVLVVLQRR